PGLLGRCVPRAHGFSSLRWGSMMDEAHELRMRAGHLPRVSSELTSIGPPTLSEYAYASATYISASEDLAVASAEYGATLQALQWTVSGIQKFVTFGPGIEQAFDNAFNAIAAGLGQPG